MTLRCLIFGHNPVALNKKLDYCPRCRTVLFIRSLSVTFEKVAPTLQKQMKKSFKAFQDEPSPLWEALTEKKDER